MGCCFKRESHCFLHIQKRNKKTINVEDTTERIENKLEDVHKVMTLDSSILEEIKSITAKRNNLCTAEKKGK